MGLWELHVLIPILVLEIHSEIVYGWEIDKIAHYFGIMEREVRDILDS